MDYAKPNATFDHDDIFERKRYAIQAMKWIDAYPVNNQGYSLVIDAPWGVGKTTFLNMWKFDLKRAHPEYIKTHPGTIPIFSVAKREVVYYNAWENDQSEDPFAPLLWAIISTITMDKYPDPKIQVSGDAIYDAINALAEVIAKMNPSNLALQTVPTIMKSVKHLSEVFTHGQETPVSKIVAAINEQQAARASLRKALTDLASACGTLFIMVDELDRCRPSFAINTLETIHQYFGIPNIVFIMGVDMTQLAHAIAGRYGESFDSGGYMSKYVNRTLLLPFPTATQMIHFVDRHTNFFMDCIGEFELVFQICDISPREIPAMFNDLQRFFSPMPLGYYHESARSGLAIFLLSMICMKSRMPESYKTYLRGETDSGLSRLMKIPRVSSLLSYFLGYMSRPVTECLSAWKSTGEDILRKRGTLVLTPEERGAFIGYILLSELAYQKRESFGSFIHGHIENDQIS